MSQTPETLKRTRKYLEGLPSAMAGPREVLEFSAALDNYEPAAREWAYGHLAKCVNATGIPTIVLWLEDLGGSLINYHKIGLLIDDGKAVVPYYYAGGSASGAIWFNTFPTSSNGWCLGPRRMYHLKVSVVK